jgi:hypothetical protein
MHYLTWLVQQDSLLRNTFPILFTTSLSAIMATPQAEKEKHVRHSDEDVHAVGLKDDKEKPKEAQTGGYFVSKMETKCVVRAST